MAKMAEITMKGGVVQPLRIFTTPSTIVINTKESKSGMLTMLLVELILVMIFGVLMLLMMVEYRGIH